MIPINLARRTFLALTALLAIALLASPASATIYKWIDSQGNVGFTDDPGKIPPAFRDSASEMSESELAIRVPIQREAAEDLGEIRIPGYAQTIPRITRPFFQPPESLDWQSRADDRKAFVPDLGYLVEAPNHGPSEYTPTERVTYINGERFILENPYPIQTEMNWADKRVLSHVFGPAIRFPELDIYHGGQP
jgi:hypothetical protein